MKVSKTFWILLFLNPKVQTTWCSDNTNNFLHGKTVVFENTTSEKTSSKQYYSNVVQQILHKNSSAVCFNFDILHS